MAVNEHLFPDLARTGYQITSPPDPIYNCIAHAAGFTGAWWWPDPDGFDYWPPGVPRERTLTAFMEAFATLGYVPCSDGALDSGWEKLAIYATDEGPTHAARQLENGRLIGDNYLSPLATIIFPHSKGRNPAGWGPGGAEEPERSDGDRSGARPPPRSNRAGPSAHSVPGSGMHGGSGIATLDRAFFAASAR